MDVIVVCFKVDVSATGWSLTQRSPTNSGAWFVCDLQTSRMRRPWPALGCSATGKIKYLLCSISFVYFFLYSTTHNWMYSLNKNFKEMNFCVVINDRCCNTGTTYKLTVNSEELIGTQNYLTSYAGCHKSLCRYNRVPRCVCVCVWNSSAIFVYRFTFSRAVNSSSVTLSHIIMAPADLPLVLKNTVKSVLTR